MLPTERIAGASKCQNRRDEEKTTYVGRTDDSRHCGGSGGACADFDLNERSHGVFYENPTGSRYRHHHLDWSDGLDANDPVDRWNGRRVSRVGPGSCAPASSWNWNSTDRSIPDSYRGCRRDDRRSSLHPRHHVGVSILADVEHTPGFRLCHRDLPERTCTSNADSERQLEVLWIHRHNRVATCVGCDLPTDPARKDRDGPRPLRRDQIDVAVPAIWGSDLARFSGAFSGACD
jgi:hypothetical protein